VPKAEVRTTEQIRAELAAERAALTMAGRRARSELKNAARFATSVPLALGGVTFVAKQVLARCRATGPTRRAEAERPSEN
jgi:hypothetical protein